MRFLEGGTTDYSHVGIACLDEGVPRLIHADATRGGPGGRGSIRMELLQDVISPDRASGAAIYRVEGLSTVTINRVCQTAREYFRQAFPFDDKFELSTPESLYCTELVWRAYAAAGVQLWDCSSTSSKKYLLPADLIRSGKLRRVADF